MAIEDIDRTQYETTITPTTTNPRPPQWANRVQTLLVALWYRLWRTGASVLEYGASTSATGAENSAAFQAAIDAVAAYNGTLIIPPGTYTLATGLVYRSNVTIRGSGTQTTVLSFGGTGPALSSATPGVRSYNLRIRDLQINYTGSSGGCLLLDDMSEAMIERCAFSGTSISTNYGVRVSGAVNGYAVYNSFRKCRWQLASVGFDNAGAGSNETRIIDCRGNVCGVAVAVTDSNHVLIADSAFESGTTGVTVQATTPNVADACTIVRNRFEGNTDNIVVLGTATNLRDLTTRDNQHVTGTAYNAAAYATTRPNIGPDTGTALGAQYRVAGVTAAMSPAFHLQTTVADAVVGRFRQSNTSAGSSTVVVASGGRLAGHALSVCTWNGTADVETAYVTCAGTVVAPAATITALTAPAATVNTLTMGDGVTSGNFSILHRKADANNLTSREWRIGPSTGIWAEQFTAGEDLYIIDNTATVIGGWQRTGRYFRALNGVRLGSTTGPLILSGTGTPEGAVAAPVGSLFMRTNGGANTTLYVKESGAGTTGWVAK